MGFPEFYKKNKKILKEILHLIKKHILLLCWYSLVHEGSGSPGRFL
jgi:hypothetical protein